MKRTLHFILKTDTGRWSVLAFFAVLLFYYVSMHRLRLNHLVQLVGFVLLSLSVFIPDVSAQTALLCPDNSITILDKVTGVHQCQECRVCPAGEGLSVDCGDVITPQTPVACKPCVLGETYSSANEAGACKDCENCGEYRETTKACTLTSKAVCGKCKAGAYLEFLLGMCKPCSPCCNDGKDIVAPGCQVPGMKCSFLRSETCRKVASVSTPSPLQITPSTIAPSASPSTSPSTSTLHVPAVNQSNQEHVLEQVASDPTSATKIIVGVVVAIGCLLVVVMLVLAWRCKKSGTHGKKTKSSDVEMEERLEQVQGKNGANETDKLNPAEVQLESPVPPVQETGESPERIGIQDSQPPGCIGKQDFKRSGLNSEPHSRVPCHEDQRHTTPARKKSTLVTVTVESNEEQDRV